MMIEVGSFTPEEIKRREDYAKSFCSPSTKILMVSAEVTPPIPNDFSMFSLLVPGILHRVKEAETEGLDAVVIDCCTDSGLEAAKMIVNIPVIGPVESSLHVACMLADKFGWITPMDAGIPFHWRQAKAYGLPDRVMSIRAVNIDSNEYHDRKDEVEKKLTNLVREMKEDGAQLIFIGCTAIGPNMGIGSIEKLSKKLNITIIDPVGIMLRVAEMMVALKLLQSKIAFPSSF
jgi:allantoin racemase